MRTGTSQRGPSPAPDVRRAVPTRSRSRSNKSYATIRNGEGWLIGCHINPYSHGTDANHEPDRDRKLLLHRKEIGRLTGKVAERGLTLIPLRLYFKHGRAKVELGLGRGKKLHDKRATLRERDQRREMDQAARTVTRAGGPRRRSRDDEE